MPERQNVSLVSLGQTRNGLNTLFCCESKLSGGSLCTLFTNIHSVHNFVHYLYTIEAVHYWIYCWIRGKKQGILVQNEPAQLHNQDGRRPVAKSEDVRGTRPTIKSRSNKQTFVYCAKLMACPVHKMLVL